MRIREFTEGKLIQDLEWQRTSEGIICIDNISGVKRPATSEEAQAYLRFEEYKKALDAVVPPKGERHNVFVRIARAIRG